MVSPNYDARRVAEQLLLARTTRGSTPTRPGITPGRSQLLRQPPLLRPLRPQRPARNARQERPRGRGADRRLSPPLEQRAQRGPDLHDSARRCCRARAPAGRGIAASTSAARRTWAGSIRPRSASPPTLHQRDPAALPADPHQRLRAARRSARAADRTARATTSTCRKS